MKNIFNYIFTIVLFFLLIVKSQAQDWVMTESDNSVVYIGDGWVKSISNGEEGEFTFMFNAGNDIIMWIDEENLRYAKGSTDDYCNANKSLIAEMNKKMPAEQLKMMQEMINQQKAKPAPKVTVSKESGGVIAGYQTVKYSINSDGELYEEKWISNDPALQSIIEVSKSIQKLTTRFVKCALQDDSFIKTSPEFSAEYQDVAFSGIQLKSIRYEYGNQNTETDVVSLEKEDIPSSKFEVPEDYNEYSFVDFMKEIWGM